MRNRKVNTLANLYSTQIRLHGLSESFCPTQWEHVADTRAAPLHTVFSSEAKPQTCGAQKRCVLRPASDLTLAQLRSMTCQGSESQQVDLAFPTHAGPPSIHNSMVTMMVSLSTSKSTQTKHISSFKQSPKGHICNLISMHVTKKLSPSERVPISES